MIGSKKCGLRAGCRGLLFASILGFQLAPAVLAQPADAADVLDELRAGFEPTGAGPAPAAASPAATPAAANTATPRAAASIQEVGDQELSGQTLRDDGRPSTAPLIASRLNLYAGEAAVRRVPGTLRRVAVGNGDVISAFSVGRGEVVLIGMSPGETNVHLWMDDGRQRAISVTVSGIKGDSLASTVRQLLGDAPGVEVKPVGSNIVVSGAELDAGTSSRLAILQKVYPQILNFTGTDPVAMQPMVLMDVQIVEFNKDSVEELGIQWDSVIAGPSGGMIRDYITNDYFRVLPQGDPTFDEIRDTLPMKLPGIEGYLGIATTIGSRINLLMNRGKAWVLASPKLSAKSGTSASFLVGGEVPIVIPSILGQSQVEYKEYGIRLNITPTVNARNQVSTSIMAEVSRIDPSVTVQGVPGFLTRRTETEVNVNVGDTIVLSGMIDRSAAKTVDKFPILGDIPILGKLFRSDGFRGGRTELVMFVTPRLISPASPDNVEGLQRAQDLELLLDDELSKRQQKLIR